MQKIRSKTFHRKTYFAWFCEFVSKLLPKIVSRNRFSFLTQWKPLDFTFSEILEFDKAYLTFKLIFKATQLQKMPEFDIFQKTTFHFSVKYEFGTKCYSSCSRAVFMKKFYFYLLKTDYFWGYSAFLNK